MLKRFLALAVLTFPHFACSAADQARTCDIRRPPLSNPESLIEPARLGNREAQVTLGGAYLFGRGVPRNVPDGIALLESAANDGSTEAELLLGTYYYDLPNGSGASVAVAWLRRAATKNCPAALLRLGAAAVGGIGVPQDTKKGFQLFKKAADMGYAPAQVAAGGMMMVGNGTQKDSKGGIKLVQQAAEGGYSKAAIVLAAAYLEGLGVEKDGLEAIRLLEGVYRKQDEEASTAADLLGQIYAGGSPDVPENTPRAIRWYALAVALNSSEAAVRLGELALKMPAGLVTKTCPMYANDDGTQERGQIKKGERVNIVSAESLPTGTSQVYLPSISALVYTRTECVTALGADH